MRIELDRIREKPFTWSETLEVTGDSLERPEVLHMTAVECEGRLTYADPGFLLQARLRYEQTLECDRCLGPLLEPVAATIELVVLSAAKVPEVGERALEEQDLSILTVAADELDTVPILLEQVQLNLPMKPLCSAECRGLCASCGIDLNRHVCDCVADTTDPRWQALAALRDRIPTS